MATEVAAQTRRMTREDVVRLGKDGSSGDFVPIAAQALRLAPADTLIRILLAANLGKLGLGTLARRQLAIVPAAMLADLGDLSKALERTPDDVISQAERFAVARANVDALRSRGLDLAAPFETWAAAATSVEAYRDRAGNVIRVPAGSTDPSEWIGLGNHRAAADHFAREIPEHGVGRPPQPHIVEGLDPPWVFLAVYERTGPATDGSRASITLVQANAAEFLEGLSQVDLRRTLLDPRVNFFVGPDAAARLREDLRSRFAWQIRGVYIPLHSSRTRVEPPLPEMLAAIVAEQDQEHDRLRCRVAEIYGSRDRAWWSRRYASAGPADPLRILIPTTRYSTYIRHASADLAGAFCASGCRAELLIEPDDATRFASIAYLRKLEDFRPDLVILINYTRASLGDVFPASLPFVCWIQDGMPHQFDEKTGRAQGELDFLAGHLHKELFDRFGYPRARCLEMPVVASPRKFHPGPVETDLVRSFGADMAFVSHHSEPPEAMHERLRKEATGGREGPAGAIVDRLRPLVHEIASTPMGWSPLARLEAAVLQAIRQATGGDLAPALIARLLRGYAIPLADRIVRHESLHWAADVCERRNWRLVIYGRGWEMHPRFGPLSRGELAHGEDLRSAYQCAGVHLHVSLSTIVHQRVLECAMSGGLPLCRLNTDALSPIRCQAQFASGATPVASRLSDRQLGYRATDGASLMAFTALLQRLGLEHGEFSWTVPARIHALEGRGGISDELRADGLLGDLALTTFQSADDLEHLCEKAIVDPRWRTAVSTMIARRAVERLSTDAFARRLLKLVRSSLEGPP